MKKSHIIYPHLKKLVAALPPATRIPSVRALMKRFEVSQATIMQAMARLKENGMIVTYQGDGSYTAGTRPGFGVSEDPGTKPVIGLAVADYPSPFYLELIQNVGQAIYNAGYKYSVIRYNWRMPLTSSIEIYNLDALLLVPTVPFSPDDIRFIHDSAIPVVLLGFLTRGLDLDIVGTDNEYGGAVAANYFLKTGHKKMAILHAEPDNSIFQSRMDGFIKQNALAEITDVEIINPQTAPGENSAAMAYSVMSRAFRSKFDFSAIFALSDASALGLLKAAHDNGVKIPETLSVIGYDDLPESQFFHPALSSVRQNLHEWGHQSLQIIKRRLAGYTGPAIQKYLNPELVLRESVAGKNKDVACAIV